MAVKGGEIMNTVTCKFEFLFHRAEPQSIDWFELILSIIPSFDIVAYAFTL